MRLLGARDLMEFSRPFLSPNYTYLRNRDYIGCLRRYAVSSEMMQTRNCLCFQSPHLSRANKTAISTRLGPRFSVYVGPHGAHACEAVPCLQATTLSLCAALASVHLPNRESVRQQPKQPQTTSIEWQAGPSCYHWIAGAPRVLRPNS